MFDAKGFKQWCLINPLPVPTFYVKGLYQLLALLLPPIRFILKDLPVAVIPASFTFTIKGFTCRGYTTWYVCSVFKGFSRRCYPNHMVFPLLAKDWTLR